MGNGSINPCIGSFNVPISNATPHDDSPALFNPTVAKVSRNGYRVTCNINTTIGISKVLFPTWTEANGQDDIIYHEGTILGNTANVYIKTSEHNNEIGTYITHIYAYDQAGNALGMEGYGIVIRDDNEPFDGYGKAQEYEMKQKEKKEKAEKAAKKKAEKIKRDEEYRRKKAEQKKKEKG